MLIKCDAKVLKETIATAAKVVPGRPTLPILSTVMIEAIGDVVKVSASNLDQSIVVNCEAVEVEQPGAICLPCRMMLKLLAEQCGEIVIDASDANSTAKVICSSASYEVTGYDWEEFPLMEEIQEGKELTIEQGIFKGVLQRTSHAMSSDLTRFILNGVCLWSDRSAVHVVGTDGRRLHTEKLPLVKCGSLKAVIPTDGVKLLLNELTDGDEPVEIIFGEKMARFSVDEKWTIHTKLIDGTYPNWRQVIPAESGLDVHAKADRSLFIQALKKVMVVLRPANMSCKVELDGAIRATAMTPDIGKADVTIGKADNKAHPSFTINPIYVIDALRDVDRDEVMVFASSDNTGPVLLTAGDYIAVIMPLRYGDESVDVAPAPVSNPSPVPSAPPHDAVEESDVEAAVEIFKATGRASTSSIQRRMRIGYTKAARIMEVLEERGIIGPPNGSQPRAILIDMNGKDDEKGGE